MSYVRAAVLLLALGTPLFVTACGGNSGIAPPLQAQNSAGLDGGAVSASGTSATSAISTLSTASAPPTSGYTVHVLGSIVAIKSASEFEIHGGTGVGYLNIYTTASTTKNGTLAVGQTVDVYGTGSVSSSVTAMWYSVGSSSSPGSSSGSPTPPTSGYTVHVTGSIVALKSASEFEIHGGTGIGYLNIYTTSRTTKNGTLAVGQTADVYGTGSISSSVTATWYSVGTASSTSGGSSSGSSGSTPSPGGTTNSSVPAHVLTAGLVYVYGGTSTSVSIASMAPYLSWAQTGPTYGAALRSAGVKVDVYTNFWKNYTTDNPNVGYVDLKPGGAHAAAEVKSCSGTVEHESIYGGGYVANALSSEATAHAQVVVNYREAEFGGNYDAVFSDDTGSLDGDILPCGYTYSGYQAGTAKVLAALGKPVFINGINAANDAVGQVGFTTASNVLGGMCEGCISYWATNASGAKFDAVRQTTKWEDEENAEALMASRHKIYWAYARAIGDASSETALRTYTYASFLLTYDPNYSMLQEVLKTPSGFEVFPETGLVPMNPVTTASSTSGYLRSGGAYMREFGNCYYRKADKGRCAVVVNPSYTSSVSIPTTAYHHKMSLSGYGVLDGGSVAFNASAPSSLAPGTAAILFP